MPDNDRGKFSVVLITVPETKLADAIAAGLVKARLAACVNVLPQLTSHYNWEGKLRKETEVLLLAKTRAALVLDLIQFVREKHSAKVPEIISLPIMEGYPPYLAWLGAGTRIAKPERDPQLPL